MSKYEDKKQFLLDMKKEVEDLERQIKYSKLVNLKNSLISGTLINGRRLQFIAPFVLTASILAGGCKLIGMGWPFYSGDLTEEYLHTKKEFDSVGNIRYEEQYGSFSDMKNIINHYTKWEDLGNGFYERRVESYDLDGITDEKLEEMFSKENVTINDIFGEPISSVKETKNNLTEEELMEEEYMEATIYKKDTNEYIKVKESFDDNFAVSAIYILVTAFFEFGVAFYRCDFSKFDYSEAVHDIKQKYKKVDVKKLRKQLEIKKENYDRLVK